MSGNSFKTSKGTELPLLDLKGKQYLQVAHRLVWFREEKPGWGIETEFVRLEPTLAVAKATVRDETGRVIAMGHKSETPKGFPDFIEKSETGAVGRALALCGYGTQFTNDFDEGERIVDSPVGIVSGSSDSYVVPFGKKYRGMTLRQIVEKDGLEGLDSYANYIKSSAEKTGRPSPEGDEFIQMALLFVGAQR